MVAFIESIMNIRRQTVGARSVGLVRVLGLLVARGDCPDLVPCVEAAIELHRKAARLAFDWRRAQKNGAAHLPGAQLADRRLDRAITQLHDWLDLLAATGEPVEQSAATILLNRLFPNGPGEMVNATYLDEHALVTTLVEVLAEADLAEARAAVDIESLVARIERLNTTYGDLLVRPERLDYATVRAADQTAFEAFTEVIARLVGRYPTNAPQDLAARTELLQPLLDQQDHLSDQRTRDTKDAENDEVDDDIQDDPEDLAESDPIPEG